MSTNREEKTAYYLKTLKKLKSQINSELLLAQSDPENFEISSFIIGDCHETIKAACILFGVIEQEQNQE